MFIKALKKPISGYSNVTTKALLNHLYDRYGQLTPADFKHNDDEMNRDDMETMLLSYLVQRKNQQADKRRAMWNQLAGLS